jgi:hypothetical protein
LKVIKSDITDQEAAIVFSKFDINGDESIVHDELKEYFVIHTE